MNKAISLPKIKTAGIARRLGFTSTNSHIATSVPISYKKTLRRGFFIRFRNASELDGEPGTEVYVVVVVVIIPGLGLRGIPEERTDENVIFEFIIPADL